VEPPVGEHLEQHGVLPSGAGGGDAQVGLGLGEVEALREIGEHRRRGLAGVEAARVDLADVDDEVGLGVARLAQDLDQAAK
jgi:hypothetical protein